MLSNKYFHCYFLHNFRRKRSNCISKVLLEEMMNYVDNKNNNEISKSFKQTNLHNYTMNHSFIVFKQCSQTGHG